MASNYNFRTFLLVLGLVLATAGGFYLYFQTESFKYLEQARAFLAKGDIHSAHDKAEKAMIADPFNRQAVSMKADLFVRVQNDTHMRNAREAYNRAERYFHTGRYNEAMDSYIEALTHIDGISSRAQEFEEAKALEREIAVRQDATLDKIAELVFRNAMRMFQHGDLMRAYNHAARSQRQTQQIITLKNEIAFALGQKRFQEISTNPASFGATFYNDAFYWLGNVTPASAQYEQTREMIDKLKNIQPVSQR